MITLKNIMKGIACVFEDNNIKIDIEPWSGRGKNY